MLISKIIFCSYIKVLIQFRPIPDQTRFRPKSIFPYISDCSKIELPARRHLYEMSQYC